MVRKIIDLRTITEKHSRGHYSKFDELLDDLHLMCTVACRLSAPNSQHYNVRRGEGRGHTPGEGDTHQGKGAYIRGGGHTHQGRGAHTRGGGTHTRGGGTHQGRGTHTRGGGHTPGEGGTHTRGGGHTHTKGGVHTPGEGGTHTRGGGHTKGRSLSCGRSYIHEAVLVCQVTDCLVCGVMFLLLV